MNQNSQRHLMRLSLLVYNIKHKITDLEYYNIMETMKEISNSSPPRCYVPPPPSSTSSVSNSSTHISSSADSSSSSDICY